MNFYYLNNSYTLFRTIQSGVEFLFFQGKATLALGTNFGGPKASEQGTKANIYFQGWAPRPLSKFEEWI